MFTGIISDLGSVAAISPGTITRLDIKTQYQTGDIEIGASVACNGICLSVVERLTDHLVFEASNETLAKTTLGAWRAGTPVNLEKALRVGDELGGHLVSGHVDGVGTIVSVAPDGGSTRLVIEAPPDLAPMIASKGSIAIDGVSLTVNEVSGSRFGVNIIPITQEATSLGGVASGDRVNLEIDLIARYVSRLLGKDQ